MGNQIKQLDAVIVGAGFSGMYMLHMLREKGFTAKVFEAGGSVGGTWYWNRYPGACCDVPSVYYSFTFSEKLYKNWTWSSKLPYQEEILQYLNYVADSLKVRDGIQLNTKVTSAVYNEQENVWNIKTSDGNEVCAKYFITAVGSLSAANTPSIPGMENFKGETYHTGHWPHEPVSFKGKKVAVIGTGSSAVQTIPVVAEEAEKLTVFQRTPSYVLPARNGKYPPGFVEDLKENFDGLQRQMNESPAGFPVESRVLRSALEDTPEERYENYKKAWEMGGWALGGVYYDTTTNDQSNEYASEFVRNVIRETVTNPKTAEMLCPTIPIWGKRLILGTNYYETFNRDHVDLVSIKETPIVELTENGIRTSDNFYQVDAIIFATGYDAMAAPIMKLDVIGRNGLSLREKWQDGLNVSTCLGITNVGFPNMFSVWGPQSPVFANIPKIIEINSEWVMDLIEYCRTNDIDVVETTDTAEAKWMNHINSVAEGTIFMKVDSWYNGANIDGMPKRVLTYLGDVLTYRKQFDDIAENGYRGFTLTGSKPTMTIREEMS
ncbi:flavin-containing monooxygenase [Bacillus dakarensis]|uniref:flavin-containing monooxygenase n=1 Tax=Robertmurraya dakarensis TaxID=1926278 RepID=UPI0009814C92|nr:NAD(P)/FAD-dependent oxidoreductase [Bacillus dakarensis]